MRQAAREKSQGVLRSEQIAGAVGPQGFPEELVHRLRWKLFSAGAPLSLMYTNSIPLLNTTYIVQESHFAR